MADLLLELFSEEIPARMQADAEAHLKMFFEKNISLPFEEIKTFSTPRRLAISITSLPLMGIDEVVEFKGPKTSAPQAALDGFLKKYNLSADRLESSSTKLEKRMVGKDEIYFLTTNKKGVDAAHQIYATTTVCLESFPWPKSMRWGSGETAWVRPLHSILCLFDGKVVPVEFAGVKAGNKTRGHRFLAPAEIIITDAKQYESAFEKAFVLADRDKRKTEIAKQLDAKCKALGVALHVDAGLLEEVTGLVEWPTVLSGKIDASYMDLPEEVLILEMKNHQKYFATRDAGGKLSPHFLITSNMLTKDDGKAIIAGNERVLRARFADGRFFYDQDRKTRLEDWAKKLKDVTYHAKLGSVADKLARVQTLADTLAPSCHPALVAGSASLPQNTPQQVRGDIKRAAQLCKADLTTGMVGEFPELQGVMGRYYANHQKEKPEVADAIRDHYKPQGPSDSVPTAPVSICVALADKLDTLIAMFAIGEKPTGSKDPFALRRAALGVIRIVLENNLRLPLKSLLAAAPLRSIALHKAHDKLVKQTEAKLHEPHKTGKYLTVNEAACEDIPEGAAEKLADELLVFFHDRLKVQLKDDGIRHDVIAAVVAGGDDDLVRIVARAKALQEFLGSEDGVNLLAGYKRAANILAIEEKKDNTSYKGADFSPIIGKEYAEAALKDSVAYTIEGGDPLVARGGFQVVKRREHRENELAEALNEAVVTLGSLLVKEEYNKSMSVLASLRDEVDRFFSDVMINVDDKSLRINRLRLLAKIRDCMNNVADFSKIEG